MNTLQITITARADASEQIATLTAAGYSEDAARKEIRDCSEQQLAELAKRWFRNVPCEVKATATL